MFEKKQSEEMPADPVVIDPADLKTWEMKAAKYVDDPAKTENLLTKAFKKANDSQHIDAIKNIWDQIQLLFSLLMDWVKGNYKGISKTAIISVIAGLIYFVSPIDIVPDWIVGLGLVDDAAVLGLIIHQLDKELKRYRTWKDFGNNGYIEDNNPE